MPYAASHNPERCQSCGACGEIVDCPGASRMVCYGCGACVQACPNEALKLIERPPGSRITIEIDGQPVQVPQLITVKEALLGAGYPVADLPEEPGLFVPCQVGACWSCAVEVDGRAAKACVTGVSEGMKIKTHLPEGYVPQRIVMNFSGHPGGGVGTPWQVKRYKDTAFTIIEAVCFTAGCNFKCPQCQNWFVTWRGTGEALTPGEAAQRLTLVRRRLKVDSLLISGGECSLNRPWLVQFVRSLKALNPEPRARFHVDTNGSVLTHSYLDELMEAGMTNIGIDLKAQETETFMRITGLQDRAQADKYKEVAWEAVEYLVRQYAGKVFVGIGIPYNREFISMDEMARMGERLLRISPELQVTAMNYRPEFRSKITIPEDEEMERVRDVLRSTGLKTVLSQGTAGYIGP